MDPGSLLCMPAHYKPAIGATGYGLAVDLGTTNISLSLWDLSGGRRIGAITGANPQFRFGSDVVSRLTAAGESKENAKTLAQLPLSAMRGALREMNLSHSINLREVRRVNIVGNTTMLALLTEMDPDILLQPRSWTQPMDCSCYNCKAWAGILGIDPGATISVSQPLAGFVGSDLLAGALATNLTRQPGSLLLDFGTNIEMVLWDGKTLHVTSAPGGPAFEQTAGTYGSDMVNCIANLIGKGVVTSTGKLLSTQKKLKPRDVDMFQRAKAGTGAGTAALLAKANLSARELQRVCICGIFGSHLNIANAQKTGLLPDIPADRIQLCGDTALSGCELLLLSHGANAELAELRKHAAIINLAQMPDFETLFMENLYLKKAGK
jgi:uncharacterized 2Fe-2S/4Fe-4S cluster protein (DUF4445 family)